MSQAAEPERISDYRVVDVLGRGGMGVVYHAVHGSTGKLVAIKTVRVASESTIESIRREIQMLRELDHPGVVAIRDSGVTDGMPWYAMDLMVGRTLRDDFRAWFPNGDLIKAPVAPPYSLAHVVALFRAVCEPLAYVHGQGVIHRDLSPGNIFLVGANQPVLFDFGLAARHFRDSARDVLQLGGITHGTAHYMAPEQARGEVVDARADVYALGCILYEALTGRPPFLGESSLTVLMQHLEDVPRPPSAYVPSLPGALDELVMRMLAKAPRDRIGYVEDVATALERLGAPVLAVTDPPRAYTYRPGLAGRTTLLSQLDAALLRESGCVCLVGESGVGKTRLAAEVATRAIEAKMRVIPCECEPHAAPLHPLRPVLRALADAIREDRLETDELAVLAPYEPELAELVEPELGASRVRVIAVMRVALTVLAADRPVVIVLDDLQWADELTHALLSALAGAPVLLLATARADELTAEVDATLTALGAERLSVPRLDRAAVGAMVRDMLALDDEAPTLTEFVATRSAGNPLFAAEYVRIAVDEGVLRRDVTGRWRLSQRDEDSYDKLPTPGSIRELVRKRLDGLSPDARELALAAAVLGRPCPPRVIADAAGITDALPALTELIQRHVLEDLSDGTLRLVHDSLREQAYGELGDDDRRRRHAAVAAALPAEELAYAELAYHHERAGDVASTIAYLAKAGDLALATAAYGDARNHYTKLLALAPDAAWQRRLGEACFALGDLASAATHMRAALAQHGRTQPASKLGWAVSIARGIGRQVATRVRKPRRLDPALAEPALASKRMASVAFFADDSLALIGSALDAVNLAERAGGGVAIAEIYAQLGYVAGLARLGSVARGYFRQARATARSTRDTHGMCRAVFTEAAYHVGIGAWDAARANANDGLVIAVAARDPMEAEVGHTILGHVEFATGDYAASRAQAIALYESARTRANAQHEAWGVYTQARAALYTGALPEAIAGFTRAMGMLVHQSDDASKILCGGMLANALARAGELERAGEAADETTARIGDNTPPVFTIAEGFAGAAEAYLEIWRCTGSAGQAQLAIRNVARLARVFPIARPAAYNLAGIREQRLGKSGTRLLRRGLALATKLGLPYDQRVAREALRSIRADDVRPARTTS